MKLKKLKIFYVQKNSDTSDWYICGDSYEYLCICHSISSVYSQKLLYSVQLKAWNEDWTIFSPYLNSEKIYNVLRNVLKCS